MLIFDLMNIIYKNIFIFIFCYFFVFNNICVVAHTQNPNKRITSYSYMYDCIYNETNFYQNQTKVILELLQKKLSKTDYTKILDNQNKLMKYEKVIRNGEIKILTL